MHRRDIFKRPTIGSFLALFFLPLKLELFIAHWNWEGRPLFFNDFSTSVTFFVLQLYFFSTTSWFLLRNRAPWWLWTELQKRLLKRFWNFWMLTALESSNSNTEPIRSKQCLLEKKSTALLNKKLHSWRNPVIDLINSSELRSGTAPASSQSLSLMSEEIRIPYGDLSQKEEPVRKN